MNLHPLHPDITPQAVLAECARELAQRRNFYPGRVAEARMSQAEADHQLALAAEWHEDAQRVIKMLATAAERYAAHQWPLIDMPRCIGALSWHARREGLTRELALRARVYPARVAEMRMTQGEADHRRACLMALAARYDDGFDWRASNGHRTRFGLVDAPEEILAARREWQDHRQAVEAARAPMQQKELI